MDTDDFQAPKPHIKERWSMLKPGLGGGPHGIGDPNDKSLRVVEVDVCVPNLMRQKAKKERCPHLIEAFGVCAKDEGFMMPFRCRRQARELTECLEKAYADEEFVRTCTRQFIEERTLYRATGISKIKREKHPFVFDERYAKDNIFNKSKT